MFTKLRKYGITPWGFFVLVGMYLGFLKYRPVETVGVTLLCLGIVLGLKLLGWVLHAAKEQR